ncbi:hypothetical protein ACS0TY_032217 [Phlomoides rotata]
MAVREGVRFAVERGVGRLVVEVDSQIVYHALLQPKEDLSYFGRVIREILRSCDSFYRVDFSWVRRTGNSVAHTLAQYALRSLSHSFFITFILDNIVDIVDADFPAI